jgi:uncharacterized protein with GYD domain
MPAYITLFKFTQQGLASAKGSPDRLKAAKPVMEKMGGRLIGAWWTLGEYDLVAIAEWADEQAATAFLLILGGQGNLTSTTMRAFSEEEFAQIAGKLP